jgi:hypothetical protein
VRPALTSSVYAETREGKAKVCSDSRGKVVSMRVAQGEGGTSYIAT